MPIRSTSQAFTLLLGLLAAVPYSGIDINLPALAATGATLGAGPSEVGLTMSAFVLSLAGRYEYIPNDTRTPGDKALAELTGALTTPAQTPAQQLATTVASLPFKSVEQLRAEAATYDKAVGEIASLASAPLDTVDQMKVAVALVERDRPALQLFASKFAAIARQHAKAKRDE